MQFPEVQRVFGKVGRAETANVGETLEGLQRFPINIRYPRELRDSVEKLSVLPFVTEAGATTTLGAVADLVVTDGPPQIRSESARLNGWIYVDISGHDLGRYVRQAQQLVAERVALPPGYSITWSGQFEYLERATKKLTLVIPVTLAIIFVLLYLTFRSLTEAALIMVTLPFAPVGGLWCCSCSVTTCRSPLRSASSPSPGCPRSLAS
jgi:Cu(I)/Ag(I) efflux system membrane protein CusA/SilA